MLRPYAIHPWTDDGGAPAGDHPLPRRFFTRSGATRYARRRYEHAVIMCLANEARDTDF